MSNYSVKMMAGIQVTAEDVKEHELILSESNDTEFDKKPVKTELGKKKEELEIKDEDELDETALDIIMAEVKDIVEDETKENEIVIEQNIEKDPCDTITEEAEEANVFDMYAGDSDKDESPDPYHEDNDKMPFPPELKKSLEKEMKELHSGSIGILGQNELNRRFYNTVHDAMGEILMLLSKETVHGFKEAQIQFQTYMGPIQHKFPDSVFDFLMRGGKPQSVSTLFKTIKEIK